MLYYEPCLQQSFYGTGNDEFIGNEVCEDGLSLYANYTQSDGNVFYITGIPLVCVEGRYSTVCNDNTSDPRAAVILCRELGYYGESSYMNCSDFWAFINMFLSLVI